MQALRALRALAGAPAAALVAGGLALGGAGASLTNGGLFSGPSASAGGGGAGFAGSSASVRPGAGGGTGSMVLAGTALDVAGGSALVLDTPPDTSGPSGSGVPRVRRLVSQSPLTLVYDAPTSVPEPAGLAWAGFLAVAGAAVAVRRRSGTRT